MVNAVRRHTSSDRNALKIPVFHKKKYLNIKESDFHHSVVYCRVLMKFICSPVKSATFVSFNCLFKIIYSSKAVTICLPVRISARS